MVLGIMRVAEGMVQVITEEGFGASKCHVATTYV